MIAARSVERRTGVFAGLVAIAVAMTSCGFGSGGDESGEPPAEELRAAIEATLDSSSFRLRSLPSEPGGASSSPSIEDPSTAQNVYGDVYVDYLAPDRARSVSDAIDPIDSDLLGEDTIVGIGDTTYMSLPDRPGYYTVLPPSVSFMPAEEILEMLRGLLESLTATPVERDGDAFTFTVPAGLIRESEAHVEATVLDGRLKRLLVRWELLGDDVVEDWEYSMYGSVLPINAPAPDNVLPFSQQLVTSPDLEPCGPDGLPPGSNICGFVGPPPF